MQVNGRPVAAFDPEGLVFSAGVDSEMIKLYDLRSFDKVRNMECFTVYLRNQYMQNFVIFRRGEINLETVYLLIELNYER